MKVRTIIGVAIGAVWLTSTALADKYDHLVAKGYRWITTDGPFACRSKDDLQRLFKDQSEENKTRMVSQGGLYYLIRGVIVQVVQEDKASGMSQVHWDGIVGDLWTPSKFLSKHPITNILGTISVPGQPIGVNMPGINSQLGLTATPNRLQISDLINEDVSAISVSNSRSLGSGDYTWKLGISTTVFWIGEQPSASNPLSNEKSAWDSNWIFTYGGTDTPISEERLKFVPASFIPRQNPFYVALPYNDVDDHHTKPEAAQVIPWYKSSFVRDGQSVCKGRWVEIRHGKKVCYAQWEDVGPFQTDQWQYVFGDQHPRPNGNGDAGLDVSPAVRDYLGLANVDFCDWKFVDFNHVLSGPWTIYGDNNIFSRLHRSRLPASTVHQPVAAP